MEEKRKVERFQLRLETIVGLQGTAPDNKLPMLFSHDISSEGVFLLTDNPLSLNTMVNIGLFLPQVLFNKKKGRKTMISTTGKVVRTNENGMAVSFDRPCQISNFHLKT